MVQSRVASPTVQNALRVCVTALLITPILWALCLNPLYAEDIKRKTDPELWLVYAVTYEPWVIDSIYGDLDSSRTYPQTGTGKWGLSLSRQDLQYNFRRAAEQLEMTDSIVTGVVDGSATADQLEELGFILDSRIPGRGPVRFHLRDLRKLLESDLVDRISAVGEWHFSDEIDVLQESHVLQAESTYRGSNSAIAQSERPIANESAHNDLNVTLSEPERNNVLAIVDRLETPNKNPMGPPSLVEEPPPIEVSLFPENPGRWLCPGACYIQFDSTPADIVNSPAMFLIPSRKMWQPKEGHSTNEIAYSYNLDRAGATRVERIEPGLYTALLLLDRRELKQYSDTLGAASRSDICKWIVINEIEIECGSSAWMFISSTGSDTTQVSLNGHLVDQDCVVTWIDPQ